jgi:hypothetical protein
VVAVLVGIVVVAALKSKGGDPRGSGAPVSAGAFPGTATPVVAPPWPRSAQEYAALLASPDPAIAAWAKQNSPTMSIDATAPNFVRQDDTIDADAFIAYALRRATEIAPDALPMQITIMDVSASGKILHRPSSSLITAFIATSRAVRPPGVAASAPWDGYCFFSIAFVGQLGKSSITQVPGCPAVTGRVPSCKINEVLTLARAKGLPVDATVNLIYNLQPEAAWMINEGIEVLFKVPDQCGTAAAAVPADAPVDVPRADGSAPENARPPARTKKASKLVQPARDEARNPF